MKDDNFIMGDTKGLTDSLRRKYAFICVILISVEGGRFPSSSGEIIGAMTESGESIREIEQSLIYNSSKISNLPLLSVSDSVESDTTERDMSNDPLDLSVHPTLSAPLFRPVFTTIKTNERHSYSYIVNASVLKRWPAIQLQFYAETENAAMNASDSDEVEEFPLLVTVHWHGSIRSWEIPIHRINHSDADGQAGRFSELIVGKSLWDYPSKVSARSWNLTVEFSVAAEKAMVYYKLRIVVQKNFNVPVGKTIAVNVSPTSPSFFRFRIPPRPSEYFFIHVVSQSSACTLMSIQQPRGPFLDQDESTFEIQYSETFTEKTGLTIPASDFPDGFLVVFIPFENDAKCRSRIRFQNNTFEETNDLFRQKSLTFQVREAKPPIKYLGPILMPIMLFLVISVAVFTILFAFHFYKIRCINPNQEKPEIVKRPDNPLQSTIMITDLIITEPSRVVDQTRRYCRAGLVTSAFYLVPVFQLILTFSKQLLETGNFDICYFNHFCSHMLWRFHDFNHMYSNIWYILFGLLYIAVVYVRQMTCSMENGTKRSKNPIKRLFPQCGARTDRGVMTHYGLLYSMGFALIMTGVMSAGYHICPNQSNFQFDTVFMYTIAAISVVTIYQSRHPTYLSANFTFTALALVTCITVLGLLWENLWIRVVFSVIHLLFLILSLPKVCYNGYVRRSHPVTGHESLVFDWLEVMKILCTKLKDDWRKGRMWKIQRYAWTSPNDPGVMIIPGPGRLVLPGFLLFINVGAIVSMWTFLKNENFATQVLFICVMNGSLYTIYYSVLKMLHGECRRIAWIQPGMYLSISLALWAYALYFFFDEVSTWENSPAESRLKNRDCVFLGFYDTHDMWHFLSAASLFCSAMVLLTFDDDLVDQPKSTIPVF